MPSDKQHAVELLNQLDPSQLAAVVHLLEVMVDDDDTLSPSERKAIAEAGEWLKHNEPIPHEQVLREFGLTRDDWERMCDEPGCAAAHPAPAAATARTQNQSAGRKSLP